VLCALHNFWNDTMTAPFHYGHPTVLLHWLTALLVAAGWGLGQVVDLFGPGFEAPIRSTHILLGLTLAVVLAVRIVVRLTSAGATPPEEPGLLARAAKLGHGALYLLMVAVVAFGVTLAWSRGTDVFGLFRFAAEPLGSRALRGTFKELHELAANALVIVAGLHAVAALLHHYVLRDGVLRRMLPAG
jgi:cytochrome b561